MCIYNFYNSFFLNIFSQKENGCSFSERFMESEKSSGRKGTLENAQSHPSAQSGLLRTISSWVLNISKDVDYTASLGNS